MGKLSCCSWPKSEKNWPFRGVKFCYIYAISVDTWSEIFQLFIVEIHRRILHSTSFQLGPIPGVGYRLFKETNEHNHQISFLHTCYLGSSKPRNLQFRILQRCVWFVTIKFIFVACDDVQEKSGIIVQRLLQIVTDVYSILLLILGQNSPHKFRCYLMQD